MLEVINEKISVVTVYNRLKGKVFPIKIRWQGKNYRIVKIGYQHKIRIGRNIVHIFHVTDGVLDFRIACNTENLHWTLEEVSDGIAG